MNNDCKRVPTKEEVAQARDIMQGYLAGLAGNGDCHYNYLESEARFWQTGWDYACLHRLRFQNQ